MSTSIVARDQDRDPAPGPGPLPVSPPPALGVRVLPALAWRTGLVITIVVTVLLLLTEIDRLSGQIPSPLDNRVHPFNELVGPRPSVEAWWAALSGTTDVLVRLLVAHVLADTLFIVVYAWLGLRLTSRSPAAKHVGRVLLVAAAVDLAENGLIIVLALTDAARPVQGSAPTGAWIPLLSVIVAVTTVKWLLVALTVFLGIRALQKEWPSVAEWVRTARFAVRIQRFGVVVLGLMVLLSLVPRDGVFDQLPDVQRAWPESVDGALQFTAAAIVLLVIAAGLFVLGRLRSQHLLDEQKRGKLARPPYPLYLWLVAPAVLWAFALVRPGDVLWGRLVIATLVLVVVAVVSYALRFGCQPHWLEPTRPLDTDRVNAAARLGDLVAVGLVASSGLGLVRAFAVPLVLGISPVWSTGLTLLGLVVGLAVWPVAARAIDRLNGSQSDSRLVALLTPGKDVPFRPGGEDRRSWRRAIIPTLSFLTGLAMLVVACLPGIAVVGVPATVMLVTGLIALFLGSLVVLCQDLRPPEALAALGFRTTPVVILLVAMLVAANLSPASTRIHGLRMLPGEVPARPTLDRAFNAWLTATDGCGRTASGGVRWRPLVLYAAEGGGIRAAYWTARGIDVIGGDSPRCAAAFLSGGASGGAVGLTVSQVSESGRAAEAVTTLSRSDGLAKASMGMFLRDVLRAGTGLPLTLDPDEGWQDRAALIEGAWERDVPALQSAYLGGRAPGQPGNLVLNTTAVSSGCRVFLSQVVLSADGTGLGGCDGEPSPGGRSVDFFALNLSQQCVRSLRASTAALTASRFPYVTPAAAIGCEGRDVEQLVDGGYVENSGLGTLVDLWPELSALVRAHNDGVTAGSGQDYVVPMVVYLTNSPGADLAPPGRPVTEELLVPPVAYLRASGAQSSPSALLQRARELTGGSVMGQAPPGLPARRVFVVYPATRPAISAPLGWTLSGMSRTSMDEALAQQVDARCGDRGLRSTDQALDSVSEGLVCRRGYGTLGDLVGALRG